MSQNREVTPVNISQEMQSSYLDYAMSVIVSRALPDVRDGFKPVHRRILYAMHESGYHHKQAHRKSARIVGEVIGKYHPHGDLAIYEALVRMAQPFSLRVPLIDGQGNFGSIDGDAPAAIRYTEARLEKISQHLLADLNKETVDFVPNYDGSEIEPRVLPAMFPNLLINGSSGIAVGMATNIPPHNLAEVMDACCLYLDDRTVTLEQLLSIMKGPDFPSKGSILGHEDIKTAYRTGKGLIRVRGRASIEENQRWRKVLVITEIPYAVNKARMIEKIAELTNNKVLEGISDLRDESNKSGMRVVIELKKEAQPEIILNQLYALTSLQTTFGVNMLAIDGGIPKLMNLQQIISAFVSFREEVVTKRIQFLLKEAKARAHIVTGLYMAVSNIDKVVSTIKISVDASAAKQALMQQAWIVDSEFVTQVMTIGSAIQDKVLKFSELQAKAILEMKLQRLTSLEKDKIAQELTELITDIKQYLEILSSRPRLLDIIRDEFIAIKSQFSTPRLTSIITDVTNLSDEDLIERLDMVVTVTLRGYIKRVPLTTYRIQKRGGKGRSALSMASEDAITEVFVGNTHTSMLFFSDVGQVYHLKLHNLPLGTPETKGRPIVNLLSLSQNEKITNIMPMPEDKDQWHDLGIFFVTSLGRVRKNSLTDFANIKTNGKVAIKLKEDDSLVTVKTCKRDDHLLLATNTGKVIRFAAQKLRTFKGRSSDGVNGINLGGKARVISAAVLQNDDLEDHIRDIYLNLSPSERHSLAQGKIFTNAHELGVDTSVLINIAKNEQFVLSISSNGFGKRTSIHEYRITNRAGLGVSNMKITGKTGELVAVMVVTNSDELMLMTNGGKLIRMKVSDIRASGRNTMGVILFKTNRGEQIVSAALVQDNALSQQVVIADDQV